MFAVNQPLNNINYNYDRDHDVLYLYIGKQSLSYADEPYPGIYIKYSDDTDKLTGAVIIDYKKRDINLLSNVLPIDIDFSNINTDISVN